MSADTDVKSQGMRVRTVRLMPEVDVKLTAYAHARRMTPEAAAADAIENYLREHADIAIRIADARAAFEAFEKARDG